MKARRARKLFRSVFTRLLVTTLGAGMAITLAVIVGFLVLRFHSESAFTRNLLLYAEYVVDDLGDPPNFERAKEIARRTGLVIRFDHPQNGWQTGPMPRYFNLERAWIHRQASGMWLGSSKGHHFLRINHGGGTLYFIVSHDAHHGEHALWMVAALASVMGLILAGAYLIIRHTLNPLHALKTGVDQVAIGKLDHRIPEAGPSELRDLARAFNDMARRLDQLLHSKEQLLLDVSHELRSPITRLKVQLEFIEDADARESLRSDLAEMEAMVTTLLESARLRHAAAVLNLKSVDMSELARALTIEFSARPPGVVFGALDSHPVQADPEKMKIVLRNLIDNALKHTPADGPAVSISMASEPGHLEITVADQGEGIAADELPHLFEPFYRPDRSRSRKTGGYGLGLSLCKAIMDAHGGSIALTSQPGQGTRATIGLPRIDR